MSLATMWLVVCGALLLLAAALLLTLGLCWAAADLREVVEDAGEYEG